MEPGNIGLPPVGDKAGSGTAHVGGPTRGLRHPARFRGRQPGGRNVACRATCAQIPIMKTPELLHFFFDYVDPASFLLERRIRAMEDSGLFPLVMEPFELGPPPRELLDPLDGSWAAHWKTMDTAAEAMNLRLARPWIVPWTRKAHELALHAREEGRFREIHDAIYRAYLLEGQDIGRVDVLVNLAQGHGLDRNTVKPVLDVDLHTGAVVERRERGLALGVTRVPTLIWKGRTLEGYPDTEVLESFLTFREGSEQP
jgi:predicted DsbA family dithiol-disulfide isomerase